MKVLKVRKFAQGEQLTVMDIETTTGKYKLACGVVVSNSKRVSLLDVNAMISHNAVHNLREAGSVRGQKNDDYLLQYLSGYTPTQVKVPVVYNKFVNTLQAAGINVIRRGPKIHLMAMTDKDAQKKVEGRYLLNAKTADLRAGDLTPIAGGLFDPKLTAGHNGTVWSGIKLEEKMPNPVMEEPIRRLLDLTKKDFTQIISGEKELGGYGTGPTAIEKALANISVPAEMKRAREHIASGKKSFRDSAVRKLRYLKTLEATGQKPSEWMMSVIPVLPAAYRGVGMLGDSNIPLVADPNYMYQEAFTANDVLKQQKKLFGDQNAGQARLALYQSYKALTGLADPTHPKLQQKGIKGLLAGVFGSSPKMGTVQRKLIASSVDNVGRGVVVPDSELDMDSIGLPEDMSFTIFKRGIVRNLRRRGLSIMEAKQHVEDKTDLARKILLEEMDNTPVQMVRAPAWHKFSTLSFKARPVAGRAIHVSPLIVQGYTMDFDGDKAQIHAPMTAEAIRESKERLMPSKNLLAVSDLSSPQHVISNELLAGLHYLSSAKNKKEPRVFTSKQAVIIAMRKGEIGPDDPVKIIED